MTRIRSLFQWLFLLSAIAISVLLAAPAWAAYVIYVQGTNNLLPGTPNVPVSTIFNGSFNGPENIQQNVSYPATFGLLNVLSYHGPGLPPTLNQSVAIGVANLDAIIKKDPRRSDGANLRHRLFGGSDRGNPGSAGVAGTGPYLVQQRHLYPRR